MNMQLREKLKEVQIRFRKLGYELHVEYGYLEFRSQNIFGSGPDSYIRANIKISQDNNNPQVLKAYFYAEPCRILGGSSYMTVDFAKKVCEYWRKLLKECEYCNALNIMGTEQDITECMNDIRRRSRS